MGERERARAGEKGGGGEERGAREHKIKEINRIEDTTSIYFQLSTTSTSISSGVTV